MTRRFVLLVMGVGICFFPLNKGMAQTTPPAPVWQARYDGGYLYGYGPGQGSDNPTRIVTDAVGNSYVTGQSSNLLDWDFATIKYDPNGTQLWAARYNGGIPTALVVDQTGNVYVGGSTGYAYVTVKYDAAGRQLWVKQYSAFWDTQLTALAIDGAGNVYVTGSVCVWQGFTACVDHNYTTIKYAADGTQVWAREYDQGGDFRSCVVYGMCDHDYASGLGVDAAGNVYVTGLSYNGTDYEAATVKYDTNGNQLWVRRYNRGGFASARALRVDGAGNVYIAGESSTGATLTYGTGYWNGFPNLDVTFLKYDANGNLLLEQSYEGGYTDHVRDLALDSAGNIYLAGDSQRYEGVVLSDYVTLKYRADGIQEWVARYRVTGGVGPYAPSILGYGPGATALRVDSSGNIYVTGTRCLDLTTDINVFPPFTSTCTRLAPDVTIKYDPSGSPLWTVPAGSDLAVDDSGNLYVTTGDATDFLTFKYAASDIVIPPLPDLAMVALSTVTTRIVAGYTINLSNTVTNYGAATGAAFAIAFHLSSDAVYGGADDIAFGDASASRSVASLGAGQNNTAVSTLTVPLTVPDGAYYLCAMADANDAVLEGTENNNAACSATTVAVGAVTPTITAVDPSARRYGQDSSTAIMINGSNFVPGAVITVGSLTGTTMAGLGASPTTPFVYINSGIYSGRLSVWWPNTSLAPGSYAIQVTNPPSVGSASASLVAGFTVTAPQPSISLISPTSVIYGIDTSQSITIFGTNFFPGAVITVGLLTGTTVAGLTASATTPFVYTNSATLRFWWPNTSLAPGAYTVQVTNPTAAGGLSASLAAAFTVNGAADTTAPVVSAVAASGVTSTGATVTWTTNEASDTQVDYGMTTSYGSSTTMNTSLVTSHSAVLSGLTASTLYHYQVKSRDAAGNLATGIDGTFTTSAAVQPTVTSVSPTPVTYGIDTSKAVTIYGSNFVNGATITVGSLTGTTVAGSTVSATVPFVYVSSSTLRFWWPNNSLAPGLYTVQVTNPSGTGASLAGGLTVRAPQPAVTSTAANPVTYGTSPSSSITIYGSNFITGATITVGSLTGTTVAGSTASATTPFVYVSNSQLKFYWPNTALAPGAYTVTVTNPSAAGGLLASRVAGFTVNSPQPAVTSIAANPVTYGITPSLSITIYGSGFVNGATITVGGLTGTTVAGSTASATVRYVYVSSSQLKFYWPNTSLTPGAYAVQVSNPTSAGGLSASLAAGFTVQAPQTAVTSTAMNPVTYGINASSSITIYGANFINGATITVGSLTGTTVAGSIASATVRYIYVSSSQLKFYWPNTSLAPGAYAVQVTNPAAAGGLSASLTAGFTVNATQPTATYTSLNPVTYGVTSSRSTTIYGSNFLLGATITIQGPGGTLSGVTVAGSSATSTVKFVYYTSGQVKFWWGNTSLPAGSYDVIVTDPAASGGLSATLVGGFVVQ